MKPKNWFERIFPGGHDFSIPDTYIISGGVFRSSLALIYLFAFSSLIPQIKGLWGENGILPLSPLVANWLAPITDPFLQGMGWAGVLFSLMVFFNLWPCLFLFLLWALYLFFSTFGGDFLSFQWDALLLETGLISVFFFCNLKGKNNGLHVNKWSRWLLLLLLFRLMFGSGLVKLSSGDPAWRDLLALNFHYETQPLPTPLAWFAHQLPPWWQKGSCLLVFVIELILPWAIWITSRRIRVTLALTFIFFQGLIILTGNYAFFNLLTISLCFLLVPDASWPAHLRERWSRRKAKEEPRWSLQAKTCLVLIFCLWQGLHQFVQLYRVSFPHGNLPAWSRSLLQSSAGLGVSSFYGLFAVMTLERREIVLEGSASPEGDEWRPYQFSFKPGELDRTSGWVAPYQPRLDWQMWFAALGSYQENRWFISLVHGLLQGKQEMVQLLASNPFGPRGPARIRAKLYLYHFTNWSERFAAHGSVWKREELGLYLPPVGMQSFHRPLQ